MNTTLRFAKTKRAYAPRMNSCAARLWHGSAERARCPPSRRSAILRLRQDPVVAISIRRSRTAPLSHIVGGKTAATADSSVCDSTAHRRTRSPSSASGAPEPHRRLTASAEGPPRPPIRRSAIRRCTQDPVAATSSRHARNHTALGCSSLQDGRVRRFVCLRLQYPGKIQSSTSASGTPEPCDSATSLTESRPPPPMGRSASGPPAQDPIVAVAIRRFRTTPRCRIVDGKTAAVNFPE